MGDIEHEKLILCKHQFGRVGALSKAREFCPLIEFGTKISTLHNTEHMLRMFFSARLYKSLTEERTRFCDPVNVIVYARYNVIKGIIQTP